MFTNFNFILLANILFPIVGIIIILLTKPGEKKIMKLVAFNVSSLSFVGFLFLWVHYNKGIIKFQFIYKFPLILLYNQNIILGIDGISLLFLLLNLLLIITFCSERSNNVSYKLYFVFHCPIIYKITSS
jgi:NADH:ubiquinone oxidoreductase subunit 4 (subunit M)